MHDFSHIDTWVFDLDNTLYDAESHIFVEMGARMNSFVAKRLNLPLDQANIVRRDFFLKYGTTLRGLMTEHQIAPDDFLHYVHDFDITPVKPCPLTQNTLSKLEGRKVVFTNAQRSFALRMLDHLGIRHHFDGVFAIEDADYWPKPRPETYSDFFKAHGVDPKRACMFEDMEINLKTAHDFGMTTVWFHGGQDSNIPDHVHHHANDLPAWLTRTFPKG